MSYRSVILTVILSLAFLLPAYPQDNKQPPVKAKQPTVVSVEGSADKVPTDHARMAPAKKPNPVIRLFTGIGHGISRWCASAFDGDDVIPTAEERRARKEPAKAH